MLVEFRETGRRYPKEEWASSNFLTSPFPQNCEIWPTSLRNMIGHKTDIPAMFPKYQSNLSPKPVLESTLNLWGKSGPVDCWLYFPRSSASITYGVGKPWYLSTESDFFGN